MREYIAAGVEDQKWIDIIADEIVEYQKKAVDMRKEYAEMQKKEEVNKKRKNSKEDEKEEGPKKKFKGERPERGEKGEGKDTESKTNSLKKQLET